MLIDNFALKIKDLAWTNCKLNPGNINRNKITI